MGMFDELGAADAIVYPSLNTSTALDILTGVFELGENNKYYLNGGLPFMFGIGGRGGFYKSTVLESILVSCLYNYPYTEAYKIDTENNSLAPKKRMKNMCIYRYGPEFDADALLDRLKVTNISTTSSAEFEELIKNICKYKEAHKKDLLVETPFLDKNGEPLKMWIPTFLIIDSLTLFVSSSEVDKSSTVSAESKDRNMDALRDGMFKRRLLMEWSRISCKYGIYFLLSAQVDDSYVADEYSRPEKQNQYTKLNDRFKGVGPMWEFLTNTLLQNFSPSPVTSSTDKKLPEYSSDGAGLVEINELTTRILRCKTSPGGTIVPMLASQNYGVLPGLTYYHYLKKNGDFGFNVGGVGKVNRYNMLMPDVLLKRQNVIDVLRNNHELNRALEIMFQLKWIIDFWNTASFPFDIPKTAELFVEKIAAGSDLTISDIVNSRGYWTYDKSNDRPYLSIFDILSILDKKK